tara:strand:- start:153 stop:593 length:441 start_codon:yes stop_codon:yes gene_type:complete
MGIKMDIKTFARKVRYHDWSAAMSDSGAVARRGREGRAELATVSAQSPNHKRVWELGFAHHADFMWRGTEGQPCPSHRSRAEVNETAWRWVGAFLWVHGVKVTEEEAKTFVGAADGHKDWYGSRISTAKDIDWSAVDARIREASDD